ncbi:MAG TPA: hypothetical protein DCS91_00705 [Microcoleaceae bacterium UBA11344]|jgi:hypothetical protein|nr:hypothetical protein [Microcoleaceae cyanobacterium UBA11344]
MFFLTPEARKFERVTTGNRGYRGAKTSAANLSHVRSRVYKDEALVAATLGELPELLASLESFRE